MKLKCKINDIEYDIVLVQGNVFSEEYNETLDSGSIILSHVEKIEGLLPYDDVFVYDGKSFERHLLVDKFTYERLNPSLHEESNKIYYTYKIELFSETKGLETVQLPNISITQPKEFGNKHTKNVLYYLEQFINMYSPLIKVRKLGGDDEWIYERKYVLDYDEKFREKFMNVYAPSFSLNNPNLRDVLSQLMLTKDMIPIVKNGVISGLDMTQRNGVFNTSGLLSVTGSRTSENHCDSLRRTYNNALSQENTCKNVEFLGFRNSDTALMTLDNMRLETRFPIYKINKMYLCCYKKGYVQNKNGEVVSEHVFLCKHNMTKLVKQNNERQLLSKDWHNFIATRPDTVEEASQFRMVTVGYDIGSRYITGWGEKHQYINVKQNMATWWNFQNSYIQNIVQFLHDINPLGIYTKEIILKKLGVDIEENIFTTATITDEFFDCFINPLDNDKIEDVLSTNIAGLKGIFFEIEYEGFFNGTVIHSKDDANDNIVMNDNSNSSLALLEKDGLFQKEKVNRFGNETVTLRARYQSIDELQPLGSVYDDDIIIFHREYSIYENFILATYYGSKDYVLKNYFTTVFSKHRPFNLLSYEESVRRSENKKIYLLLSKNQLYYEKSGSLFYNDIDKILSFYKKNPIFDDKEDYHVYKDIINYGYITIGSGNNQKRYASDINIFNCGDSLCFNMAMYDNVSGGVYIYKLEPDTDFIDYEVENDYIGSIQKWYMTVNNVETGFLESAGFYFSHTDTKEYFDDSILTADDVSNNEDETIQKIKTTVYNKLFALPLLENNNKDEKNIIGNYYTINKDNKEIIDITYQIEPISKSNDVFFSPWLMKLSDLFSVYDKFNERIEFGEKIKYDEETENTNILKYNAYYTTLMNETASQVGNNPMLLRELYNYGPLIILRIPKSKTSKMFINQEISLLVNYNYDMSADSGLKYLAYFVSYVGPGISRSKTIFNYSFNFNKVIDVQKDNDDVHQITLSGENKITYSTDGKNANDEKKYENIYKNERMIFKKLDFLRDSENDKILNFSELFGQDYDYFVNMEVGTDYNVDYFGNSNVKGFYSAIATGITEGDPRKKYKWVDMTETSRLKETTIDNFVVASYYLQPELEQIAYEKNIFVVFGIGEEGKLKKHLISDEYDTIVYEQSDSVLNSSFLRMSSLIVEEQIEIKKDEKNRQYLEITIPEEYNNEDFNPSSFQIWYYYEGSYKFVFGVNLSDDEKIKDSDGNAKVKIYVSLLSNRDPRVYTSRKGILDGYVQNYLEEDSPDFGDKQYYKPIKKQ